MALIFDSVNNRISSTAGPVTFPGRIDTPASVEGGAGFRLPHGTAPSAPVDGDVWTTTGGMYARINGATVGPFAASGGSFQPLDADLTAIAALTGTSGFLKTDGAGVWSVDTNTYSTTSHTHTTAPAIASTSYGDTVFTWRQESGTFAGHTGWASYLISNHGNGSNYYNQTLILPFEAAPKYSRLVNNVLQGPYTFITTENYTSYVVANSGGTFTGRVVAQSNSQTAYSNAALETYSSSGDVHISWHCGGSSATSLSHARGGDGLNCNTTAGNVRAAFGCSTLYATGEVYAYYSDERLKTRLGNIENALDKVSSLSGFLYVQNDLGNELMGFSDKVQVAVSAQQVQVVQPEAVVLAPFDTDDVTRKSKSGENYLTVKYERLVPLLIEAIKELKQQVDDIKTQLTDR